MIAKDSDLAHRYLDGLKGIEIGAGAHNPFHIPDCVFVDYTADMDTEFKRLEMQHCGAKQKVDIVAPGDDLPFLDEAWDYVLSSHVIEHFFDPIKALSEWQRVLKPGGLIFIICPHVARVKDEKRPVTRLRELMNRHNGAMRPEDVVMADGHHDHQSVWDTASFLDLCAHLGLNVICYLDKDDKVGNGFCVVIRKPPKDPT